MRRALLAWYAKTSATYLGAGTAILTASGSPKSCCSRPAWRPCWSTTTHSWRHFLRCNILPQRRRSRCWPVWSGLGYYRRARMLHRAVGRCVGEIGGAVPRAEHATAKAAGSRPLYGRCHRQHLPWRACRRTGWKCGAGLNPPGWRVRPSAAAWKRAQELLDHGHPGDWNQAMMELGATICTPRTRSAGVSAARLVVVQPLADSGRREARGRRRCHSARAKVQSERNLIERGDCIFLVQRPADAAKMAGMWELPESSPAPQQRSRQDGSAPASKSTLPRRELYVLRHSITDTDYHGSGAAAWRASTWRRAKSGGQMGTRRESVELPLTGLTRKILRKLLPGQAK